MQNVVVILVFHASCQYIWKLCEEIKQCIIVKNQNSVKCKWAFFSKLVSSYCVPFFGNIPNDALKSPSLLGEMVRNIVLTMLEMNCPNDNGKCSCNNCAISIGILTTLGLNIIYVWTVSQFANAVSYISSVSTFSLLVLTFSVRKFWAFQKQSKLREGYLKLTSVVVMAVPGLTNFITMTSFSDRFWKVKHSKNFWGQAHCQKGHPQSLSILSPQKACFWVFLSMHPAFCWTYKLYQLLLIIPSRSTGAPYITSSLFQNVWDFASCSPWKPRNIVL